MREKRENWEVSFQDYCMLIENHKTKNDTLKIHIEYTTFYESLQKRLNLNSCAVLKINRDDSLVSAF